MKKCVLVLGTDEDYQSVYMRDKLESLGVCAVLTDSRYFPNSVKISYNVNDPADGYFYLDGMKKKIPFSDISGVYYRTVKGVPFPDEKDYLLRHVVQWNNEAFFESFTRILSCTWVNHPEAVTMHHKKPLQLQKLKKEGFLIPHTTITNDIDIVLDVLDKNPDKEFIFKPVRGWANTELLTRDKLTKEAEGMIKKSPITLQEYVKGDDIRVYVIKDDVCAIKIDSLDIDSRQNFDNKHSLIELPDDIKQTMINATKTLGLLFSAVDIKKTDENKYYILEANATPVFVNDETASGYPISDKICNLLINGA